MATFPRTEADITGLARSVIAGLNARAEHFPSPRVSPAQLQSAVDDFEKTRHVAKDAAGQARKRFKEKAKALRVLVDALKMDLRYAEYAVKFDNRKLKYLGWSGRKPRASLEPPGVTRNLEILREGPGWIDLDWKRPMDGGKVAVYKVQAKVQGKAEWNDVAVTPDTEIRLESQERGVEWNYRVYALNKAGDGFASNIVTAVL